MRHHVVEVGLHRADHLIALARFLPKKRVRKEKKLIGGEDDEDEVEAAVEEAPAQTIIGHWSNNLTLTLVTETTQLNLNGLSEAIGPHVKAVPPTPGDEPKHYYPIVFPNDFWLLRENMMPINDTLKTVNLHVNFYTMGSMKFNIYSSMTVSFDQQAKQQGTGNEMDEVKRMLTETSPWLLGTTAIVTVLHMVSYLHKKLHHLVWR